MLQQGLRLDRVTRSTRTEREPGVLQIPRGLTVTGPQDWGPGSYRGARLRATRAGPPSGEPLKQKPTLPSLKATGDTGGHQPFSELSLEDESWKAHLGVVFKTLFEHTDQFYLSHTR